MSRARIGKWGNVYICIYTYDMLNIAIQFETFILN
jgi:hypothetical protein